MRTTLERWHARVRTLPARRTGNYFESFPQPLESLPGTNIKFLSIITPRNEMVYGGLYVIGNFPYTALTERPDLGDEFLDTSIKVITGSHQRIEMRGGIYVNINELVIMHRTPNQPEGGVQFSATPALPSDIASLMNAVQKADRMP